MYGRPGDDGLLAWAKAWSDAQRARRRREWWENNRHGLAFLAVLLALYLAAEYIDQVVGW